MGYRYCDLVSFGEVTPGSDRHDVQRRLEQYFKIDKKSSALLIKKRGLKIKKKLSAENARQLQKKMSKIGLKTAIRVNFDRKIFIDGLRGNHPFTTGADYEVSFEPTALIPTVAATTAEIDLDNNDAVPWFKASTSGFRLGYKFLLMVSLYLAVATVIVISGLSEYLRGFPLYGLQFAGFVLSVLFLPLLFEPQRQFLLSAETQGQIRVVDSLSWRPFQRIYRVLDETNNVVAIISHSRMTPMNTETLAVDGSLMFFNENRVGTDQITEELASEISGGIGASNMLATIMMMLPGALKKLKPEVQQKEYCRVYSGETEVAVLFKTARRNHLKISDMDLKNSTRLVALAHCLVSFGA